MSSERNEKLRPFPYRQLFWKWHLYAGWFGGPLVMLIAITGGLLVFGPEIDRILLPDMWNLELPSGKAPAGEVADQSLLDLVAETYPGASILRYSQSSRNDEPYYFLLTTAETRDVLNVWVNPYTKAIVGHRRWESSFMRIVEQLHRRLLYDVPGSIVMELITGWMIVLTITGLYLWFPKNWKGLKHGLTFSFQGSAYKTNWRLHNTLGAWTALVILTLCLSGMLFSYYTGGMYEDLISWASPDQPASSTPAPPADATSKPIDELLTQVRRNLSGHPPLEVFLPRKPGGIVTISVDLAPRPSWSQLRDYQKWTFNSSTGEQLKHVGWADLHPLVKFWQIAETFHFGSVFGWPTKLIALISCFVVPVLSLTGYLIWWWKRQGRLKAAARQAPVRTSTSVRVMPVSKGLIACLIVVGIVFPTIGVSFLVLLAWEVTLWTLNKCNAQPA